MILCAISLGAAASAFSGVAQPQQRDPWVRPATWGADAAPTDVAAPVRVRESQGSVHESASEGARPKELRGDRSLNPGPDRIDVSRGGVRPATATGSAESAAPLRWSLRWSQRVAEARAGRIAARVAQARADRALSAASLAVANTFAAATGLPSPLPVSLDRSHFLRLSEAGDLRASVQLLLHPELLATSDAAGRESATVQPGPRERELRRALYLRLVAQAPQASDLETFEVLERIEVDVVLDWLTPSDAVDALRAIEVVHGAEPIGRRAKLARALTIIGMGAGSSGANVERADAAAARLLAALVHAPEVELAKEASDLLWRLLNLRPGRPAPPLCGNDADGNELCLGDLRGRIVLISFWSLDDADAAALLDRDAAFVERYWDHPFTVFGVNRDPDRAAFLRVAEEFGLPGNQVYDGPLAPNLSSEIRDRRAQRPDVFEAWRERGSGSQYLIDSTGVIRAVDPRPELLPELIQSLIDEHYRETRRRGL